MNPFDKWMMLGVGPMIAKLANTRHFGSLLLQRLLLQRELLSVSGRVDVTNHNECYYLTSINFES